MKTGLSLILMINLILSVGCGQKDPARTGNTGEAAVTVSKLGKVRPKNAVKAPDFTLATVDGEWVSLKDFRGKVVLLNFWGTWCAPCRREIPDFIKLYDKYQKDGLEIVGITLSSGTPADIKRFMEQWNMNYTVLTDIKGNETQMVTRNYGDATGEPITGIPTTFLIDREGYIVKSYLGPRTEEIFYNDLKPYL
jgi:peroxiredoxin